MRLFDGSKGDETALPDTMKGLAGGLAVLVFAVLLLLPLLLLLRRGLDADVIGTLADDELGEAAMDGHTSLEGGGAPLSGNCSDMVVHN